MKYQFYVTVDGVEDVEGPTFGSRATKISCSNILDDVNIEFTISDIASVPPLRGKLKIVVDTDA